MELEFDKEIDAILRRSSETRGVLVGDDPPKKHLDADTIAAFAENALPQKAKLLYMEHFADCDRCRKLLSQSIFLNSEAVATAASVVSAPSSVTVIPWYHRLFKTPNLALAMGALVLAFSGLLGYLVVQNQNSSSTAIVSQVAEQETQRGGPYFNEQSNAAIANTTAQGAIPANKASNGSANSNAAAPVTNARQTETGRTDAKENTPATGGENNFSADGTGAGADSKPVAAPPPPPAAKTTDEVAGERDEKKLDDDSVKSEPKDTQLAKRKQSEDRRSRDMQPPASKSGPSRSGPLQNQTNQTNSNVFDMSVTRLVGGKRFSNRNGAWYDSAYSNQPTTNVRRGTDEFTKLDRGLRNIANTLSGTVVALWKEKAYRIQ